VTTAVKAVKQPPCSWRFLAVLFRRMLKLAQILKLLRKATTPQKGIADHLSD